MARISILSDQVANQIAAGEVIERPASIVKELVENSLDAGASSIEIEFRKGGSHYIRIEDNGCGMSKDDALLSLERHATSKIRNADDLNRLSSMGFRGEAIPSIASVSRFLLQTRETDSDIGTEILMDGGKLIHCRECGMPPGTRITVTQLFNSVPARRKFLKTVATESAHIVHHSRLYALAHPEVSFALLDDGRAIFQTPACVQLKDRVREIFGKAATGRLIEVDANESDLRLSGLIGAPGHSRSSRHEMLIFVNNRPVESRTLGYALIESYYGHIPKGRYPIAFLFLELPPSQVDVNVHPAKREIRFRNESIVRGFAVRAILKALKETVQIAAAPVELDLKKPQTARGSPLRSEKSDPKPHQQPEARDQTVSGNRMVSAAPSSTPSRIIDSPDAPSSSDSATEPEPATAPTSKVAVLDRSWRFIGLAQAELALFDTDAGIVVVDVRAAQKRIWYERLQQAYEQRSVESQSLLIPVPIELDPVSSAVLSDNMELLDGYGVQASPFGRNFFRIESVPAWLPEGDAAAYVGDLVDLLRKGGLSDRAGVANQDIMAKHAANRIVRGSPFPTEDELQRLVDGLFKTRNPLADPEGRPTFIELARGELNRRFHKTGDNRNSRGDSRNL